jgi:GNAT superfamily N-acetyltransferase
MEISTDRARLDVDLIHRFLSEESYWARGRPREVTERAIAGSLCFGAYDASGQIGFARVVGDAATFGFLADVFVVPRARGAGVGKALLASVLAHPDVRGLSRLTLATEDAHDLYARYGFVALDDADNWMVRRPGGKRHSPPGSQHR